MAEGTPSESIATPTSIVRARGFIPGLVAGVLIAGVLVALASISQDHRGGDKVTSESAARTFEAISSMQDNLGKLTADIEKIPGEGGATKDIEAKVAALSEMNNNLYQLVADLGKNVPQGDTAVEHALRAEKRAQELRNSNPELSGILYLNAFNTNPENVAPLLAYADLMAGAEATAEDLSQVIGMLDVALYRMAPESVERIVDLKMALEVRQTGVGNGSDTAPEEPDLSESLQSLLATDTSAIVADKAVLEKYVQDADYLLQQIDQNPVEIEKLPSVSDLEKKLDVMQRCLHALQLAESAETFASRAESFVQSNDTRLAMLLLNSAENAAVQSASLCDPSMPGEVLKRATDLLARLDTLSGSISENRSAAALAKLEEVAKKRAEILNGLSKFQTKCTELENLLRECQQHLVEITATAPQAQAFKVLGTIQDAMVEQRRQQANAYNNWALERCQNASSSIREEWTKTNNDARRVFSESAIATVDPALLSPEVSRVYNQVLEKLMSEMGPEDAAEHERLLTETPKKRVEEY